MFKEFQTTDGYVFEITIDRFDLETDGDYVYFGDDMDLFVHGNHSNDTCSSWELLNDKQVSDVIISKSSSVKLIFTSNHENDEGTRSGFLMSLRTVEAQKTDVTYFSEFNHRHINI